MSSNANSIISATIYINVSGWAQNASNPAFYAAMASMNLPNAESGFSIVPATKTTPQYLVIPAGSVETANPPIQLNFVLDPNSTVKNLTLLGIYFQTREGGKTRSSRGLVEYPSVILNRSWEVTVPSIVNLQTTYSLSPIPPQGMAVIDECSPDSGGQDQTAGAKYLYQLLLTDESANLGIYDPGDVNNYNLS